MKLLEVTAPLQLKPCSIQLPPSKSIANRMLILGALCGVRPDTILGRPLNELCDDIRLLARLVQTDADEHDVGADEHDVGAAGTAMRFGTAYLATRPGRHIITGTIRLQQRPVGILVDALRQLGADIEYLRQEGYPPLCITGSTSLQGGTICLKGNVSSQFISALLMIAPTLKEGLTLQLDGEIVSRPYIDMTISLMQCFGADAKWTDEHTITVKHHDLVCPTDICIEPDWTAASYWYEIEALSGKHDAEFRSKLNADSLQGDKLCDEIFNLIQNKAKDSEIGSNLKDDRIDVGNKDDRIDVDFTRCPDLAQTVVVTCCMLDRLFHFTGLRTLRIKETDRIAALATELCKLGYMLQTTDDTISWDGTRCMPEPEPIIDTYHDHRMAMAFAPCALTLGNIRIADPDVVTKSYPTYWRDLEIAGFGVDGE